MNRNTRSQSRARCLEVSPQQQQQSSIVIATTPLHANAGPFLREYLSRILVSNIFTVQLIIFYVLTHPSPTPPPLSLSVVARMANASVVSA